MRAVRGHRQNCPGQDHARQTLGIPRAPAGTRAAKHGTPWPSSRPPTYLPRRPTETVLYGLVRQHLESFLAHAREHYDGGLPRYVEAELRAYLDCGVFARGFTRAHCGACGHDLLVAFTCKSRTVCPSCSGRRMANTAAAIVDRVLPDVPVRQYVLSLPYELRKLAAFQADVLTALGRIFVDAIFASYRARARRSGVEDGQGGAINFVQRFGSLNLNVHFHVVVPDGVFTRDPGAGVVFHPAAAPTREQLEAIVQRVHDRAEAWLRRRGHLDERPTEERSSEPPLQTALDACAAIAIGRGRVTTLPDAEAPGNDHGPDQYPSLLLRILASLPGGERLEDAGYETFNIGWHEADQLARVIDAIQGRRDVEDMVDSLLADDER